MRPEGVRGDRAGMTLESRSTGRPVSALSFLFVSPSALISEQPFKRKRLCSKDRRCHANARRRALFTCEARHSWQSRSSSALNQESSEKRYIDLRTMKVIDSEEAHIYSGPGPGVSFGVLENPQLFDDPRKRAELRDLLFTNDTIPLSDSQKRAVEALLSKRSVLYMSAAGEEKDSIFLDTVLRARLWKDCVVFCATSRRSAEAMYATLCAQLGPERRAEIYLDLGDEHLKDSDEGKAAFNFDSMRVIITSPHVLRMNLAVCDSGGWVSKVDVVFIDDFSFSSLGEWEEILLAMPSRILLCLFTKELALDERELLPLWLETIQNSFVTVSPPGAATLLDRIEKPQSFPMLRTFAYNAALHDAPVQVSLTLLKDMLGREQEQVHGSSVPRYDESFLHGVTIIPALDPRELEFATVEEAEYADVCSLIVADAKKTSEKVRARVKKRARSSKRKERTASSRAAARRRREAAYSDSLLLPAIVMVRGHDEAEHTAFALHSALRDEADLLWDEDSREHLEDIIENFKEARGNDLQGADLEILHALESGIGIVHDHCAPGLRLFVEELFRGSLIPLVVIDTHLGSTELLALPCAKSVLIESSALAVCDDISKGLVMASTPSALAGRMGKDDVGNLIVLWYDDAIDDDAAGSEICSTLLHPLWSDLSSNSSERKRKQVFMRSRRNAEYLRSPRASVSKEKEFSLLSSSYDGVLRSLRRFGVDGYESVLEYTFQSYREWLQQASLHATLEKLDLEKTSIDEVLDNEDWSSISDFERRASKWNEADRVFKAMQARYLTVASKRLQEELLSTQPGRIIGVNCSQGHSDGQLWEQKLLEGSEQGQKHQNSEEEAPRVKTQGISVKSPSQWKRDSLSAAVFVAIRDQESEGNRIKSLESRWVAVCILADGMWTTLPIADVVALSSAEDNIIPNVDLLMIPHSATFDVDPSSMWAKCSPVDESEKAAVHRISDELIARVASANRPILERYEIPEYETQRERLGKVEAVYQQSPWYGREEELAELRRLRRKSAELGDEIDSLQRKQNRLEERLFESHREDASCQSAILGVLEDCHALSILGDRSMEMTPIGALGSVLPGQYPLFCAACLSLIDDFSALSPPDFVAFISVIACSGRVWSLPEPGDAENARQGGQDSNSNDDELDFSIVHKTRVSDNSSNHRPEAKQCPTGVEGVDKLLPTQIAMTINDIFSALQQLHQRHRDSGTNGERVAISDVVPPLLDLRMARAATMFASGESWHDVVAVLQQEGGYAVRELRKIMNILRVIASGDVNGEFPEEVRELAVRAYHSLERWPVRDTDVLFEMVENGVVEKHWSGNTYDKWWRSVRDRLSALSTQAAAGRNEEVESVKAEIVESQ